MVFLRMLGWIVLAVATMALVESPAPPNRPIRQSFAAPRGDLSVLTYNVKALPWPVARNRDAAETAIAEQLSFMRRQGRQPGIVMLQEAFSEQAKAIAARAGYRYAVSGPDSTTPTGAAPLGPAYAASAQWDRGEESAPVVDSGLRIMSDYPIVKVRRAGFPTGACAGFDCLASKGVLIAWIAIPGHDRPVAVIDTHLNSRESTYVALDRADRAQEWQLAALNRFVASEVPADAPAIFGGDTNTGRIPGRLAALRANPPLGPDQRSGLAVALAAGLVEPASLPEACGLAQRNRDMIFTRDGATMKFAVAGGSVPFPVEVPHALSDHAGFMIDYSLSTAPPARVTRH